MRRRPNSTIPKLSIPISILLLVVALLATSAAAQAEVTKFYNEAHSLTGDCSTTSVDTVPDPGCPGSPPPTEAKLTEPTTVSVNADGDVYVLNNNWQADPATYHVTIFDPGGHFISKVSTPGARAAVVDSTGHLYVATEDGAQSLIQRFDPTAYEPANGQIEYGDPPVDVVVATSALAPSIAVDFKDGNLFVRSGAVIEEFGPPSVGVPNTLIDGSIGQGVLDSAEGPMTIDATRHRIYVVVPADPGQPADKAVIKVLNLDSPHELIETITGSTTPVHGIGNEAWRCEIAVDERTGHIFVGHLYVEKRLFELDEDGGYLGVITKPATDVQFASVAVDNGETSPNRGYLYVPSGQTTAGNLFAYEPQFEPEPPVVESLSVNEIGETEAVLHGTVNPRGAVTHWTLEYSPSEDFTGARVAMEGNLPPSGNGIAVSASIRDLAPGVSYHYRLRAESECQPGGCSDEAQATFTTFAPYAQSGSCPANQAIRTGHSAALPDCRAYELVTPADTAGLVPSAPSSLTSVSPWPVLPASPAGDSLAFIIYGGLIPGMNGTGGPITIGDMYVAARTPNGWETQVKGPSATEAARAVSGGLSAEHGFYAMMVQYEGSLLVDAGNPYNQTSYVRYPDGSFRLPGEGPLNTASLVQVKYISPGGTHLIFRTYNESFFNGSHLTAMPLVQGAPAEGTAALYDRTPDGTLQLVSLLPGDVTPDPSTSAEYLASSTDGSAVAFRVSTTSEKGPIYLRVNDSRTVVAAPQGAELATVSRDGRFVFYELNGDLYRFDAQLGQTVQVTEVGNARAVNFGTDGRSVFYASTTVLPTGTNPLGAEPQAGSQNVYRWADGSTGFVATVSDTDVVGGGGLPQPRLWWTSPDAPGLLASRTTADGSVLLFQSSAPITAVDPEGKSEIYRFDSREGSLRCLSCGPTGIPPVSDASLVGPLRRTSVSEEGVQSGTTVVPNLSANGNRAFFETAEKLVPGDADGLSDVYEWETQGTGTCAQSGGCLFLISDGESSRPEHIFGISESGDDVFITSSSLLTPQDGDATSSIYDARVDGGFKPPVPPPGECLGESCQPAASAPAEATPASAGYVGPGNLVSPTVAHCVRSAAGKKHAKVCKKKHHKKRRHHKHGRRRNHAKQGVGR